MRLRRPCLRDRLTGSIGLRGVPAERLVGPRGPILLAIGPGAFLALPLGIPVSSTPTSAIAPRAIPTGRTRSPVLSLNLARSLTLVLTLVLALVLATALAIVLAIVLGRTTITAAVTVPARVGSSGIGSGARIAAAAINRVFRLAVPAVLLGWARLAGIELPTGRPRAAPGGGSIAARTAMPALRLPSIAAAPLSLLGAPRRRCLGRRRWCSRFP